MVLVVMGVLLPSCTGADDPLVSAPRAELRWVDAPQGGGFGVPPVWTSTAGNGMHFAMLAAASNPQLVDDLVTPYNDNGVSIRAVSLWELEPDDAFLDMTLGIMLTLDQDKDLLPRSISADDFHATEEHHGVPVFEITGWRSRDENVTVRYWIGPDASIKTRAELAAILQRIELP